MIEIRGCVKKYSSRNAKASSLVLDRIDLTVRDREFVCILGPSGCGKTTLLKIVAGLVAPDAGEVRIDNARCKARGRTAPSSFRTSRCSPGPTF